MKKFILASLVSFLSFGNAEASDRLDDLASDIGCYTTAPSSWEEAVVLGYSARIMPESVKFMGSTDVTAVFPDGEGRVVAGAIHLDSGDEKRHHGHSVWKWMRRKFGDPITAEDGWYWYVGDSDLSLVGVMIVSTGTVVIAECK